MSGKPSPPSWPRWVPPPALLPPLPLVEEHIGFATLAAPGTAPAVPPTHASSTPALPFGPLAEFAPQAAPAFPGIASPAFSAVTTLGTPQDVTVQELRIEAFFPANRETERAARAAAVAGTFAPAMPP